MDLKVVDAQGRLLWCTTRATHTTPLLCWHQDHYTVVRHPGIRKRPLHGRRLWSKLQRAARKANPVEQKETTATPTSLRGGTGTSQRMDGPGVDQTCTSTSVPATPKPMAPPPVPQRHQSAQAQQAQHPEVQRHIQQYPELVWQYPDSMRCSLCCNWLTLSHLHSQRHTRRMAAWIQQAGKDLAEELAPYVRHRQGRQQSTRSPTRSRSPVRLVEAGQGTTSKWMAMDNMTPPQASTSADDVSQPQVTLSSSASSSSSSRTEASVQLVENVQAVRESSQQRYSAVRKATLPIQGSHANGQGRWACQTSTATTGAMQQNQ